MNILIAAAENDALPGGKVGGWEMSFETFHRQLRKKAAG